MSRHAEPREIPILFQGEMVRAINEGRKTQTRRIVNMDRLRVRARHRVTADWAGVLDPDGALVCEAGKVYPGHITQLGAVSAVMPSGNKLGLKPGEFDFECPYADGTTALEIDLAVGRKSWSIRPRGSLLYVREAWRALHRFNSTPPSRIPAGTYVHYEADGGKDLQRRPGRLDRFGRVRPSIHMPKWAARTWLAVTSVRVERVQEITDEDAIAEGLKAITKDGSLVKYGVPDRDGLPGSDDDGWPWVEWERSPRDAFRKLWDSINAKRGYGWDENPWVWCVSFRKIER